MTKGKMHVCIEIAYDILGAVFSTLCHNKEIEKAEKLQDIMRQLFIFSRDLKKRHIVVIDPKDFVEAARVRGMEVK